LDLAIQGSGYFVVQNDQGTFYTRTGSFAVDGNQNISVQGTSNRLMMLDSTGKLVVASVAGLQTNPAIATTQVSFENNLSSTATTASVSNIEVYDAAGNQETWTVTITPGAASSSSSSTAAATAGSGTPWAVAVTDSNGNTVGGGTLNFISGVPDPAADQITINTTPPGGQPISVNLDFSNVTNFSSGTSSTISEQSADGRALGSLTGVSVDSSGVLQVAYSNNQTKALGSVAVADFRDEQTLENIGKGLYANPTNSEVRVVASGQDGAGTVESNELESSNVDLTQQFGQLILVQRGYQASSEVLSVTNDMIQQLFGMRGQS
jgi:flagellar hook protein FlgE